LFFGTLNRKNTYMHVTKGYAESSLHYVLIAAELAYKSPSLLCTRYNQIGVPNVSYLNLFVTRRFVPCVPYEG